MSMKLIAKKYAKALMSIAGENSAEAEAISSGLTAIKQVFLQPAAEKILLSPIMPADLKRELLNYGLKIGGGNSTLGSFITMVVAADRVELLPTIADLYEEMRAHASGKQSGLLTSAIKFGDQELGAVGQELERIFKRKIVLENRVDSDLLGGYVVRVGNTVIDQSVANKINGFSKSVQHT